MKIGFFDSGLGGLIILKAVTVLLPNYDYEFYGDTAHLPYGDRSEEEIFQLTKNGVTHLFERDCALVIIACNTASAETLRRLQDSILVGEYAGRRILGVIIPTVEEVVLQTKNNVALIATKRTIESHKYTRELEKFSTTIKLHATALSALVPLIEAGSYREARVVIENYISQVPPQTEALILGCTHYSLLKDDIRSLAGEGLVVFSQDEIIPQKLAHYLDHHPEISKTLSNTGVRNIFLTDTSSKYDHIIKTILGGVLLAEE